MKYFLCILVIALAAQASAQFQCYNCMDCEIVNASTPLENCAHPPVIIPPAGPDAPITTTLPVDISTAPTNPSTPGLTNPAPPVVQPNPTVPNTPPTPPQLPEVTASMIPNQEADESSNSHVRRRRQAVTTTTTTTTTPPPSIHFSCFEIRVPGAAAGQTILNRGCVANGGSNSQTCLRSNNNTEPQTCRLCSGHRCNHSAATGLFSSVILILATSFLALKHY